MAFIYLCATITLLAPNLVGGQGVSFLSAGYERPPWECFFYPRVFVITSLSTLFELRLLFHFNFSAAPFASFQIVISGVPLLVRESCHSGRLPDDILTI